MKKIIQILLVVAALLALAWFVKFQFNPESLCHTHPDKKLARHYYECEPGGFTFKKGTLIEPSGESKANNLKRDEVLFGERLQKHAIKYNEIDDSDLKKYWDCKPSFFQLSDTQKKEVNMYDYCRYNPLQKNQDSFNKATDSIIQDPANYQQEL